jgi:hypothetical protein
MLNFFLLDFLINLREYKDFFCSYFLLLSSTKEFLIRLGNCRLTFALNRPSENHDQLLTCQLIQSSK